MTSRSNWIIPAPSSSSPSSSSSSSSYSACPSYLASSRLPLWPSPLLFSSLSSSIFIYAFLITVQFSRFTSLPRRVFCLHSNFTFSPSTARLLCTACLSLHQPSTGDTHCLPSSTGTLEPLLLLLHLHLFSLSLSLSLCLSGGLAYGHSVQIHCLALSLSLCLCLFLCTFTSLSSSSPRLCLLTTGYSWIGFVKCILRLVYLLCSTFSFLCQLTGDIWVKNTWKRNRKKETWDTCSWGKLILSCKAA